MKKIHVYVVCGKPDGYEDPIHQSAMYFSSAAAADEIARTAGTYGSRVDVREIIIKIFETADECRKYFYPWTVESESGVRRLASEWQARQVAEILMERGEHPKVS